MVYWTPPIEAINSLDKRLNTEDLTSFKKLHGYTLDYGNEDFREALRVKVATQNGLKRGEFDVIVTQGANQGFSSIVSCLCDAGDQAILFKPYVR
jgi:aspartate/methionine/tyrosine aminotransferase